MGVTKISKNGLALIKEFEGCELKAYRCAANVLTIGWGTTNADKEITGYTIKENSKITQAQADEFLEKSINKKYVPFVTKYDSKYHWTQNEFDALVSFAYNVGSIDGLTNNGTRSKAEISEAFLLYKKAAGKVNQGLLNRRKKEKALFDAKATTSTPSKNTHEDAKAKDDSLKGSYRVIATALNLRSGAGIEKDVIKKLANGTICKCYGYYTSVDDMKWLLVVADGVEGFCSKKYLKKM